MPRKVFDYSTLPLGEIAEKYRWKKMSWRALAVEYGCPDHKTLAKYVTECFPDMQVRDHVEAQRARREREGRSRRVKRVPRPEWW